MVCQFFSRSQIFIPPFHQPKTPSEINRTTSRQKIGCPKGSKDGLQPPDAPPCSQPSKVPKPGLSALPLPIANVSL